LSNTLTCFFHFGILQLEDFFNHPELLRKWSYGLVQGLACLHRQKIIHADVKANNVLLFGDQTVKLGDFTLAVRAWGRYRKENKKGNGFFICR